MTSIQSTTFLPAVETQQRSSRVDVRNPLAGDPEIAQIMASLAADHPAAAEALRMTLKRLSTKWRGDAEHCWVKHKAPMGRYHKDNAFIARHLAVIYKSGAVNAGHLARAIPAPCQHKASA